MRNMLKTDAIFARKTLERRNGRIFVVQKSKIKILERMKKG